MNILYLHQYFSTPAGSTGTRSYEFARALVERGHVVTVVCLKEDSTITGLESKKFIGGRRIGTVDGIRVVELEIRYSNMQSFIRRSLVFLRYAVLAIREACKKSYDVVFATSTPLTAAIPGIVAHLFAHKKFVFEVRDLWPELPRAMGVIRNPVVLWLMGILEMCAYRSATRLIGLSPGIVKGIERHIADTSRVSMIPNACDEHLFNPLRKGRIAIPSVHDGDFTAIFSGKIGIANGVDAIVDAAEVLRDRNRTDIKLLIVGTGKRKQTLQEYAVQKEIDNCIFIDLVPKDKVASMIASVGAGLMVLANVPAFYYGTSPNKFFDYIASGIPVVNNYPGWLADMIRENGCGIVVAPGDAPAFADALCQLADDTGMRDEMGKRSLALSRTFSRSKLAGQFCDVIEMAGRQKRFTRNAVV